MLLHYFREPKKHRELRRNIKNSCSALRFNHEIDACCHVLNTFMLEKFEGGLACTIHDVIREVKMSDTYPLPLQASRLCDLAQVLSQRSPIFFWQDKKFPENGLLVLNLHKLLGKVVGTIFAPQGFATSSQDGIVLLSQIRLQFPDLDSTLVLSLLSKLKFCLDVSDSTLLNLVRFGRAMKTSTTRSSSCITLFQSQAILSEKMPLTSSLSFTKEDRNIAECMMLHQNSSRIPKSLTGPAPIPSSPRCEKARESCSPPQHTAPLSAVKINDQLYAMGASAGGSQPLLYSMSREVSNDLQIDLHQWTSFHSLQYISLPQSHCMLSTSFEKDSYRSACFSSNTSLSSIVSDQPHEQNHGTDRGIQLFLPEQNAPAHSSHHSPVNIHSSSTEAAKKVVPVRRRSSLIQTQHISDKYLFFPGLVSRDQPSRGIWLCNKSFVAYTGWHLQCTDPHHFFFARFIQTLILCLTSDFVASSSKDSISSFCPEKYTVWKNGLSWLSQNGIEALVELKDEGKSLLFLVRTVRGAEIKGFKLHSSLIKSIIDIKEECCPSMPTAEYFIDPSLLQDNQEGYPVIRGQLDQLIKYDIRMIAQTIVKASCGMKGESCQLYDLCMSKADSFFTVLQIVSLKVPTEKV